LRDGRLGTLESVLIGQFTLLRFLCYIYLAIKTALCNKHGILPTA